MTVSAGEFGRERVPSAFFRNDEKGPDDATPSPSLR
jgi:hypothetical protein